MRVVKVRQNLSKLKRRVRSKTSASSRLCGNVRVRNGEKVKTYENRSCSPIHSLRILGDIPAIASVSHLDLDGHFSVFTAEHFNGLLVWIFLEWCLETSRFGRERSCRHDCQA